jgi:hypothetical protein
MLDKITYCDVDYIFFVAGILDLPPVEFSDPDRQARLGGILNTSQLITEVENNGRCRH